MDRWAKDWNCCQHCKTVDRKHKAHGLCQSCYTKSRPKNKRLLIHCIECGRNHELCALDLCAKCYKHQYNQNHKEEILLQKRKYLQGRKEEINKAKRRYYQKNSKAILDKQRQWRTNNPDKHGVIKKKAALKRWVLKNEASYHTVDEKAIYERNNYTCAYCGSTEELTLDHIIPLSRKGPHSEDNLTVACQSCNSSKNNKTPIEWLVWIIQKMSIKKGQGNVLLRPPLVHQQE